MTVFLDYFKGIFTTSIPTEMEYIFDRVKRRIIEDMNGILMLEFTNEEVRSALDQMHLDKALGPNGMTVGYYKKYWDTVGPDVTRLVLGFLNRGECIQAINHTNLVLIQKIKNPFTPKDYRLISLCNVSYKIISMVLVNRLKVVLPEIIDES